jgi:hypothetical protein
MILKILVQIYFFKLSIYQLTPYLTLKESYFMPRFFFFFLWGQQNHVWFNWGMSFVFKSSCDMAKCMRTPIVSLIYKSYCNMAKYVHAPKAILASNH